MATALFKRGFRNQSIQNVHPLSPVQPALVGPAFTLRYIPAREDLNKLECSATAAIRSARRSRTARPAR